MAPLTYLSFSLLTLGVPALALAATTDRTRLRRTLVAVTVLATLTTVYALPWDGYLIREGVWFYPTDAVVGRIGYTPFGEFAFFFLQPLLTGLLFSRLFAGVAADVPKAPFPAKPVGAGGWFALALAGGALLSVPGGYYLGALLLWVCPLCGLLWAFGGHVIWQQRRVVAHSALLVTGYLLVVDWLALILGIWVVSPAHTLGLVAAGIPLEEALFFALTTLLVVQALCLLAWVAARTGADRLI
ncbi:MULTISPECIES: lycopene cyclase domain-containing protein [unclassified Haladaptatus]|nr:MULTISPECIES: lycopene cyclase domain-containing protein [unclassified Haladaptatus]